MKTRTLAYDAARAVPVYPRRPLYAVALLALVAGLTALLGIPWVPEHALLLLLAIGAAVTAWWGWREVIPAQTTDGVMTRRGDREQRAGGVASTWDVMERASAGALRRRAHILRPSLGARRRGRLAPPRRRQFDPRSVGVLLAKTGIGRLCGQRLWMACEDTSLRVGGPRTGKTLSLAAHGLDAPGALITTSTRLDLAQHVHQARRIYEDGSERVVHVFNPTGYGGLRSTVRWNILSGCTDYATAIRRAGDLIPEATTAEGERWDRMSRLYLPVLLHAAAISGRSVGDVVRWIGELGQDRLAEQARLELVRIVVDQRTNGAELARLVGNLAALNDRTRSSITGMMFPAVAWVADDTAREIGAAPLHTMTLNIPQLILARETLHIIGPDNTGGPLAPLTSALVAEVAHQARVIAGTMPGGRLDPPLTMLLDEAAVATRLPLPDWTADMGGRGVTLHMSVQSLSQLEQCWGSAGKDTLLGNVGSILVFGGGKDANELRKISYLCGERWRRVVTEDTKIEWKMPGVQRGEWEKVYVLTVAQLSMMPPGQAAVIQRNVGGVFVGWPPQCTDRKGWVSLDLTGPVPEPRSARWWERRPRRRPVAQLTEQPTEQIEEVEA